ncbi:MAG: hypothetical protein JOY58_09560 [Solirubrobacterales bacterium]|nr:hypothetical protein [Solirubrobacterales bacterium]
MYRTAFAVTLAACVLGGELLGGVGSVGGGDVEGALIAVGPGGPRHVRLASLGGRRAPGIA